MKVSQGEICLLAFKEYHSQGLKGIFVGGCFERGIGSSFRSTAHAHNCNTKPEWADRFGWICVRSTRKVLRDNGTPTPVMWHELAHILTPNHGHDDAWRAKMHELGQQVRGKYKSRKGKASARLLEEMIKNK